MPMPLSLTSMVIVLGLGLYDRTEIAPFSGVNLQALRKMFQKTCCKRGASATSSCRDAARVTESLRCRSAMSLRTISIADWRSSCTSVLRNSNFNFPRAIRARSSMSSIRRISSSTFPRTIFNPCCTSGLRSGCSAALSAQVRTGPSGPRNLSLSVARNRSFAVFAAPAFSFSRCNSCTILPRSMKSPIWLPSASTIWSKSSSGSTTLLLNSSIMPSISPWKNRGKANPPCRPASAA